MEHPPLSALKLCSLNLLKLEPNPSLIMSFPRNMALSRFVITLLVRPPSVRRRQFPNEHESGKCVPALWDKFCWRWMAAGWGVMDGRSRAAPHTPLLSAGCDPQGRTGTSTLKSCGNLGKREVLAVHPWKCPRMGLGAAWDSERCPCQWQ